MNQRPTRIPAKAIFILLATLSMIAFPLASHAYLGLMTTGELTPANQLKGLTYLENIFDGFDGMNLNVRGIYGVDDQFEVDLEAGIGEFDIMLAGHLKWVPIPDYEGQPAIGIRGGLSYIDVDDDQGNYGGSQTAIVVMPFMSKAFPSVNGTFTPFGGFPLGLTSDDRDSEFMARLALGLEWKSPLPEYENFRAIGEIGFDLSESFGSLNVGASYLF